jgi:hypothetical protein
MDKNEADRCQEILTREALDRFQKNRSGTRILRVIFTSETPVPRDLPLNRSFFRGVDLCEIARGSVEKPFHVVDEKSLSLGIREIETVVVDYARLGLEPFCPARLANFACHFLSQFRWQRCKSEWRALLLAPSTFDFVRHGLIQFRVQSFEFDSRGRTLAPQLETLN